jgi:hypothetical protein
MVLAFLRAPLSVLSFGDERISAERKDTTLFAHENRGSGGIEGKMFPNNETSRRCKAIHWILKLSNRKLFCKTFNFNYPAPE